jgi:hypothetical protein
LTSDLNWLNRITRDNKGIWGIECPRGVLLSAEKISNSWPSSVEIGFFNIFSECGVLFFNADSGGVAEKDFSKIVKKVLDTAVENFRQSVCIVIGEFHNAGVFEQCSLIKTARSLQESNSSLSLQFVFIGKWNYFNFRFQYREINGHTSSPPAESKNILHVPPWNNKNLLSLLQTRQLVANPSEFDLVACEFVVEQTAGDEFLIRCVVEDLKSHDGEWTKNIEQVLSELISSNRVIQEITERVRALGPTERSELIKLLRVHRLVRPYDSIKSEQLWLEGLAQRSKLEGGKCCIQIAGPLINTIVRRILAGEESEAYFSPGQICFEREAISTAAYRRISQIENLLRNLIISLWYADLGDKWEENLKATKTSSYNREDESTYVKLILDQLRSELVASGVGIDINKSSLLTEDINPIAQRQVSIFESARNWQKRQLENHGVELADNNTMHFLTTEALCAVFCNKKNGLHGVNKPFNKDFLINTLTEYTAIRSAVAHNQPIKLNTITRLDSLQRKFDDIITVFADNNISTN